MAEHFKHPRVRDLAWIIGSPALLEAEQPNQPSVSDTDCGALFRQALPHLEKLDADPTPLTDPRYSETARRLMRKLGWLGGAWRTERLK